MNSSGFDKYPRFDFDQKMFFILELCVYERFILKFTLWQYIDDRIRIFIGNQVMHIQMSLEMILNV